MTDERTIEDYAEKVLKLAKDTVIVRLRFFDAALNRLVFEAKKGCGGYIFDGETLIYDPEKLLYDYKEEPAFAVRLLLHILLHAILLHPFRKDRGDERYWHLATDIAVEELILSMEIEGAGLLRDAEERIILGRLSKWVPRLNADSIYREFMVGGISKDSESGYARLFSFDLPKSAVKVRYERDEKLSESDWEKIAERVKAELKTFSKDVAGAEELLAALKESTGKRYDYDEILSRFAVMSEEIRINPDEFDYGYYMYGLSTYGDMPLIEPLEYTEEKKVRSFVIAIDTSASVRGKRVEGFLERTFDILKKSVSLSERLNVHLVQCDSSVTEDLLIRSKNELKEAAANLKIRGFGGTDFRPVFSYVEELREKERIKDLKGLIYFTDGYGVYPEKAPDYDTMFVFDSEDVNRPDVPFWAVKVILENEDDDR
ncbi:MAG: VWA-like domain-containing protein [Lachnospiraceae bacterium]|nr:VWA-like domain-containing protein [Lachnospiraceae bacterium]